MSVPANRDEIEIKLRVQDIGAIRKLLKQLRAKEIIPRTFESNTLYDTPRQNLRHQGRIIRIRIEELASGRGRNSSHEGLPAILTYKGPSKSIQKTKNSARNSKIRSHFKIKTEIELSVSRANEMAEILGALGLHPTFQYEKYRTTYALPGIPKLKIELDETPVGIFLELEGPMPDIDQAALLLGYDQNDYIRQSYGALYLADCRRLHRKPTNMLFPPTKKSL
jgi:adenylate cyclase, class 2